MEWQISTIRSVLTNFFGDDFLTAKRTNKTINAKQLFAYLLSVFTDLSWRDLAVVSGFGSKSNVTHIIREVKNKCRMDDILKRMVISMETVVEYVMKQGKIHDQHVESSHYCSVFGCKHVLTAYERLYTKRCLLHQEEETLFTLINKYIEVNVAKKNKKQVA